MAPQRYRPFVLALLMLAVAGCAYGLPSANQVSYSEAVTVTSAATTEQTTATKAENIESEPTKAASKEPSECPVTIPSEPGFEATEPDGVIYSDAFPAPDPYPRLYPHDGMVWYGSEDLWTALPVDGEYEVRKSVWWSANFPGGTVEGEPDVWVTWTRLDSDEPVAINNNGKATNAHTGQEGWFMIAGIDPDQPGCWEVEATYKDATLSYVYPRP